jgi:hypothetical protein
MHHDTATAAALRNAAGHRSSIGNTMQYAAAPHCNMLLNKKACCVLRAAATHNHFPKKY